MELKKQKNRTKRKFEINGYTIEDRFRGLDRETKIEMLRKMFQIRHFELQTEQFIIRGMIHGTCHLYIGEEASAVGTIYATKKDDYITSNHRGHGHCIAKGADLNLMMAELLGKSTGYCRGRGGSMHIADVGSGNLGANGIVGGSMGIATGAGLTARMKNNKKIVICFFGDGAANEGIFHESINMASVWQLPVIYLCENNIYGMSTPMQEAFNIKRISDRKISYGIDGLTIDGNNLVEVYNTVSHFQRECRRGRGPVLIEALTYRWKGHSKSDAQVYRSKEEVSEWMKRDPIKIYSGELIERKIITRKEIEDIENRARDDIKKAADFAKSSPFPDPETIEEDVYA
jgi:acetoin:2,6-dichlorophenolindophenol oxidoreductase subunit alpha